MNETVAVGFEGRVEVVGRRGMAQKGGRIVDIAYDLSEAPSNQHGRVERRASSLKLWKVSAKTVKSRKTM